jgi:hypothetical protein
MPPLGEGLFTDSAGAGELFLQPYVRVGPEQVALFDDVLAPDVTVVARPEVLERLRAVGEAAGITVVNTADCVDVQDWFAMHGCQVAVLRPDRYVYGTSDDIERAERMIRDLRVLYPAPVRG